MQTISLGLIDRETFSLSLTLWKFWTSNCRLSPLTSKDPKRTPPSPLPTFLEYGPTPHKLVACCQFLRAAREIVSMRKSWLSEGRVRRA